LFYSDELEDPPSEDLPNFGRTMDLRKIYFIWKYLAKQMMKTPTIIIPMMKLNKLKMQNKEKVTGLSFYPLK
jgi:hypothetical protein